MNFDKLNPFLYRSDYTCTYNNRQSFEIAPNISLRLLTLSAMNALIDSRIKKKQNPANIALTNTFHFSNPRKVWGKQEVVCWPSAVTVTRGSLSTIQLRPDCSSLYRVEMSTTAALGVDSNVTLVQQNNTEKHPASTEAGWSHSSHWTVEMSKIDCQIEDFDWHKW